MLMNRLRKLERAMASSSASRSRHPRRPTVWYALTPVGQELYLALTNVVEVVQRLQATCTK
jgi:DNA-binding HxlR family transcriptional regulator